MLHDYDLYFEINITYTNSVVILRNKVSFELSNTIFNFVEKWILIVVINENDIEM